MYNFPPEEFENFSTKIVEEKGTFVELYDESCTHFVVNKAAESNYIEIIEHFIKIPKYIVSETVSSDLFCLE